MPRQSGFERIDVPRPAISQQLAATDLIREVYDLTKAANRANATLYTIDPRGLIAGPDIDQDVNMNDWNAYVRETQDSLRMLAEQTGGIAIVNQNDFDKGLKRIDNETSDYYVLGYYEQPRPDTAHAKIEVHDEVGVAIKARESYSLRPTISAADCFSPPPAISPASLLRGAGESFRKS